MNGKHEATKNLNNGLNVVFNSAKNMYNRIYQRNDDCMMEAKS